MLCRPDKIIQAIPNSIKINMAENYVEDESFDFELEEDII